ncbi:DUF6924 domain-containing protein [Streptomyces sp. NPDC056387]|uniref:DUF6924 domain-containing protein n=1 Tax=Streptomyces sp. NPDC056387 TaxID=3345803 RepID=UPI0035D72597
MSDHMEWLAGRDRDAALIIRTDYRDGAGMDCGESGAGAVLGDGDFEPYVHIADDPKWAGCISAQILSAAIADEELSVVFVADRDSMRDGPITLLAVAVLAREECDSDEEFEADGGELHPFPGPRLRIPRQASRSSMAKRELRKFKALGYDYDVTLTPTAARG